MIKIILSITALLGLFLIFLSQRYSEEDAKKIKGFGYSALAVSLLMAVAFWS